jgi:hypothetical protein
MKIIEAIKPSYLHVLPPATFFLIAFGLLFATRQLISREYGVSMPGFGAAVVGALLVGKVMLLIDKLPFIDKVPDQPLIQMWLAVLFLVYCSLRELVRVMGRHQLISLFLGASK